MRYNESMQNDHFKRRFWISVSIVIVTIMVSSLALYFLMGSIEETANAIGAARAATAGDNAEFQDLANLKKDAPTAATYQAAMDKLLASQEALITFPTQIDSLSRADAVSVSFAFQGSPTAATPSAPGSEGFTLDISGPMANILAFLKDFESNSPVLLSSLNTASLSGENANDTLRMQGMVYFKGQGTNN